MSKSLHWKESDIHAKNGGGLFVRDANDLLQKKNKYHNIKVEYDGKKFDSKKECEVYKELLLRIKAGELVKVECQYPLYYWVRFYCEDTLDCFEKKYCYIADFKITYPDKHYEIIDVKGDKKHLTREFKHKRMIIEKLYSLTIKIV